MRSVGLLRPAVIVATGESRTFYLPVPRDRSLKEPELRFVGRYIMGDKAGAMLQVLVDGEPVHAHSYAGAEGHIDIDLALPAQRHPTGFVRIDVNWLSQRVLQACEIEPPNANSLLVLPDTRLSYELDDSSPLDLASAWLMSPAEGRLVVADEALEPASFDAAWRVGTSYVLAGRQLTVAGFPQPGDPIDIERLTLPAELASLDMFAGWQDEGDTAIVESLAQVGALLALDANRILGDVFIADEAIADRIQAALAAFESSLDTPESRQWWQEQGARRNLESGAPGADREVRVVGSATSRSIAIAPHAAAASSALLTATWQGILSSSRVDVVQALPMPLSRGEAIRLDRLGLEQSTRNTVNHAIWTANFPYRSVDFKGRTPDRLVLEVAAAPDTSGVAPVLSVTWNDVLLTAHRLQADGAPERIVARIPPYAVGQANAVELAMQRLPSANGCTEPQIGFPVSVLPTSHITTHDNEGSATFVGVLPSLAYEADLVLPNSWQTQAIGRLAMVIGAAAASGLSPQSTSLVWHDQAEYEPERTFLAMAVTVAGLAEHLSLDEGQLIVRNRPVDTIDLHGLRDLVGVEVVRAEGQTGLRWTTLDEETAVRIGEPGKVWQYDLDRGDLAIVGPAGVLAWLDSTDPRLATLGDRMHTALYEWRRFFAWGVPTLILALMGVLLLLALAYRAGRRKGRT